MQEGRTHPAVATSAPGSPPSCRPTNVAELMAMGPGVICEIVMISLNCSSVSQGCSSTTWCWMSGMAA